MARDLNKAIEQGKKLTHERRGLDLTFSEVWALYDRCKAEAETKGPNDAIIDIIDAAYHAGVAIGHRNA